MTRKIYIGVAAALKDGLSLIADGRLRFQHKTMCISIGVVFKNANPSFDMVKFIEACGHG